MDYAAAERAAAVAEDVQSKMLERAGQLSMVLSRTAQALDRSAGLAEERAQRRAQRGRSYEAAKERALAKRASAAARRARAHVKAG